MLQRLRFELDSASWHGTVGRLSGFYQCLPDTAVQLHIASILKPP